MPTETVAVTKRGGATLTPQQKQASSLRRDAAMLERLAKGSSDPSAMLADAAKYRAQAEALAPTKGQSQNVGALTLTEPEWQSIETYFLTDLRTRLREGFSVKKLKAIASANPSA